MRFQSSIPKNGESLASTWTETWSIGVWFVLPFAASGTICQYALGIQLPYALAVAFTAGMLIVGVRWLYQHPDSFMRFSRERMSLAKDERAAESLVGIEELRILLLNRIESINLNLSRGLSEIESRLDSKFESILPSQKLEEEIRKQREIISALCSKTDELISVQEMLRREIYAILDRSAEPVHRVLPVNPRLLNRPSKLLTSPIVDLKSFEELLRLNLQNLQEAAPSEFDQVVGWFHRPEVISEFPITRAKAERLVWMAELARLREGGGLVGPRQHEFMQNFLALLLREIVESKRSER